MKTILVFAIPVVLIAGVGFLGIWIGMRIYRAGMREAVAMLQGLTAQSGATVGASEGVWRVNGADDAQSAPARQGESETPPGVGTLPNVKA